MPERESDFVGKEEVPLRFEDLPAILGFTETYEMQELSTEINHIVEKGSPEEIQNIHELLNDLRLLTEQFIVEEYQSDDREKIEASIGAELYLYTVHEKQHLKNNHQALLAAYLNSILNSLTDLRLSEHLTKRNISINRIIYSIGQRIQEIEAKG